jgi:hypothetical protein
MSLQLYKKQYDLAEKYYCDCYNDLLRISLNNKSNSNLCNNLQKIIKKAEKNLTIARNNYKDKLYNNYS